MAEKWVTVAEAAAAQKVHPRTVERHIKSGKLQSRRSDEGQLQVLADLPEEINRGPDPLTVVAGQAENQVQLALGTSAAIVRTAQEEARLARTDAERAWEQTSTARQEARFAWLALGIMAIGVVAAVAWASSTITRAHDEVQTVSQQIRQATDSARQVAAERDQMRETLDAALQQRARAEGQLSATLATAHRQPATRPANLLNRIADVFSSAGGED